MVAPCGETDTVLAVAKQAGLNIPSGCTFGLCGTCKVKKLSGEVHMVHNNGGISDEDIAEGYIRALLFQPDAAAVAARKAAALPLGKNTPMPGGAIGSSPTGDGSAPGLSAPQPALDRAPGTSPTSAVFPWADLW